MIFSHNGSVHLDGNTIDVLADISITAEHILIQTPVKLRKFTAEALKKGIDLAYELANKRTDSKKADEEPPMQALMEKILNSGYLNEEDEEYECE